MKRRLRNPRRKVATRRRGPLAAPRRRRTTGFSLVELLVALLVMGIGVLGVTGLQALSMQGNRAALQATVAAQLAEDMMGRIRANARNGDGVLLYAGLALGDAPPDAPQCDSSDCTPAQIAALDAAAWKCRLGLFADDAVCAGMAETAVANLTDATVEESGLPAGDGAVEVDPASGLVRVTVQWRDGGRMRSIVLQSVI